jgi:hypothetical protein
MKMLVDDSKLRLKAAFECKTYHRGNLNYMDAHLNPYPVKESGNGLIVFILVFGHYVTFTHALMGCNKSLEL